MRRVGWRLIGAITLIVLSGLTVKQFGGAAAASGWSTPVPVATTTGLSDRPVIAVGGGAVHVVWKEGTDQGIEVYHSSSRDGGPWSAPDSIGMGNSSFDSPAVAMDSTGSLHVVWVDPIGDNYVIHYRQWTPGTGWDVPFPVWETTDVVYEPTIAIGPDNKRHVAWTQQTIDGMQIYYVTSTDGMEWSGGPIQSSTGEFLAGESPVLALSAGKVHIAWTGFMTDTVIYYAQNAGTGWSPPTLVSTNLDVPATTPRLVVTGGGAVHIVWEGWLSTTNQIFYAQSNGTTWTDPEQVSPGEYGSEPTLALDRQGGLHLAWTDFVTIYYRYRAPGAKSWQANVDPISKSPPNNVDFPALAVDDLSRLHATWTQLDAGNWDIFYTYQTGASATLTPSPTATGGILSPTATPSATASTTPTSSTTPTGSPATTTPTASSTVTPTSSVTPPAASPTQTATSTASATRTPTTQASPTALHWSSEVYLPLLRRDLPPPPTPTPTPTPTPLVCDGGFEAGRFEPCWQYGGKLAQSVVDRLDVGEPTPTVEPPFAGRYSALLGDPGLGSGLPGPSHTPILVGSAWLEQVITVPDTASPRLSFWYRIMT